MLNLIRNLIAVFLDSKSKETLMREFFVVAIPHTTNPSQVW